MNKTIHYFWFGGNPKTKFIEKCIASWKEHFPDFEIKEWNESNFDIRQNDYISQAYDAKKYAFVSDYARTKVLYEQGGLYFDTDVEVVKPFYELFGYNAFAGFETKDMIAPGLVLWAKEPHNKVLAQVLEIYENLNFYNDDGTQNMYAVCRIFTDVLKSRGMQEDNGTVQDCDGFAVFPREYFCPFNDLTGELKKTENTCAIHWYSKTWMSKKEIFRNRITRLVHRYLGVDFLRRFRK